jgi:hydroxyethylthiazole kinase-like uncharacterized protein yjeF
MQKLFEEVGSLDVRCYEKFELSEDILMEHAAEGMAAYIRQNFSNDSTLCIVVGSGNNGADGIALARLLHGDFQVTLLHAKTPKSPMALLQKNRADAIGVTVVSQLPSHADIIVEAIVGTGFKGSLNETLTQLIVDINKTNAFKIACDMPTPGFFADVTLTMGALKKALFLDKNKDAVGNIEVINLGISRNIYEKESNWQLLDMDDIELPHRLCEDSHKGSYGHLAVISGEKIGASLLCAQAALRFGSGLVSLVGFEKEHALHIPHALMYAHSLPENTTAIAIGMGLGSEFSENELLEFLDNGLPLVVDADLFHMPLLLKLLQKEQIVLTPHPREFVSLLRLVQLAEITVEELQADRFKYVELFCNAFTHATLLLKGANVIIGQKDTFYINPHGSAKLAKGGSGDVLSGLIAALLAQGYTPLKAALNGSLTHTFLAKNYSGADFSLTPDDLIAGIGKL